MTFPTPFKSSLMTVQDEWIDYNGHMNVAYYIVLFDRCVDEGFHEIGLGPDYVKSRNASFFTVEMHVNYLRELPPRSPVHGTLQLLAFDPKRIRIYMELFHAEDGFLSASCEQLFLHVDMNTRRTAPFPDDILTSLESACQAHATLPRPKRAGRAITLGDET